LCQLFVHDFLGVQRHGFPHLRRLVPLANRSIHSITRPVNKIPFSPPFFPRKNKRRVYPCLRRSDWFKLGMIRRSLLLGFLALACFSISSVLAEDFSARVAKFSTKEALKVGNAWRTDIPDCLKVTLRSSKEISGKDVFFKAYFYDANGTLLREQTGPSALWTGTKKGVEEYTVPDLFKPGQLEAVYLALPEDVKKMKNVVVVFGQGDNLTYDVYPNTKTVDAFSFAEKDKLRKK